MRNKRLVTAFLMVLAAPLVALTGLRLLDIDGGEPTIAALALTPYAALAGIVLGAVTLILRRWWAGGVMLLLALTLTSFVLPRGFAADQPAVAGRPLRVMASNLFDGHGDAQRVVNLVRDNQVDVVSLVELTPRAVDALGRAGLFTLLPNRILHPTTGTAGSGLASRYPLTELRLSGNSSRKQPSARIDLGGGVTVEIVAAHPAAPTWSVGVWYDEFNDLPHPAEGQPRILAGDFNATLDHATLRGLLDSGYHDAAESRGDGLIATWPSAVFPPPVTIDHVLVDQRIAVTGFKVFDVPGSDHHAVYAELIVPVVRSAL